MTTIPLDDIAPQGGNGWKPEIGEVVKGTIVYAGTFIRLSDYTNKNELVLRVDLDTGEGDPVNVYATLKTDVDNDKDSFAKRDAKAIASAVRAAGETGLSVGGTLAIKRVAGVTTPKGEASAYQAQYRPPAVVAPVADVAADGAVDDLI